MQCVFCARCMPHPGLFDCPLLNKMAASGHTAQTDRELRAELKRLGYSAGPVTDSTRQVYLKKLATLQAEEKLKSRAPQPPVPGRKLLGFSSDESDDETAASRRRSMPAQSKSLRRRSVKARPAQTPYNGTAEEHGDAAPNPPKHRASDIPRLNSSAKSKRYSTGTLPSGRSLIKASEGTGSGGGSGRARSVRGAITAPQSRVMQKKDEFSDSDVDGENNEEVDMEVEAANASDGKESYSDATHATHTLNQTYTKDTAANDSSLAGKRSSGLWWSTTKPSPRRSLPSSTPRTSTPRKFNNRLSLADAYDDEVDASKLSTTQNNSNALAPISRNRLNSRYANLDHDVPGPSTSNNKTPLQSSSSSFLNSKSNHTPGSHSFAARPANSGPTTSKIPAAGCPDEEEENLLEEFATEDHSASSLGARIGHHVPMILLTCAFLFFIVLGMVYMNVGTGNLEDVKYMYIADHSGTDNHGGPSEEMQHIEAMRIVQALYEKLSEVAGKHACGSQDVTSGNMSFGEVRAFLKHEFREDIKTNDFWLAYHLDPALQKIINNSQWGIRLFDEAGEPLVEVEDGTAWLESTHLTMSLLCRVRRSAAVVLFRLLLLCLVVLALWLTYKYTLHRMRREKEAKTQVHQLVDAITEMLASHHKVCSKDKSLLPYLAIPHVRDTLIPLMYRKEKQHLWDRAVHFINTHESRVRVETQQVSGEEFLVWRWMLPSPVVVRQSSFTPITELELNPDRVKVWQGTAFDNLDTAIKAPRYIPTPCLKIRNMFDPTLESDGDWHVAIEDAILERCGYNVGITHIAVDRTSREGCVYVKCLTHDNAGQAYRALQGSWFDGKLVTVKYLRLERYHQRFPAATSCNIALRPSNNLQKSLSHQHRSSGLESS